MLGLMPAMLHGIMEETFAGRRDIMLVGLSQSPTPKSLSDSVAAERPDVLVVDAMAPDAVGDFVELFVEHPSLRILAIGQDARSATMHELYLRRWCVADPTPRTIVDAVHALHAANTTLSDAPMEPR